jgi:alpha-tubulin suppressor-like RCC1 family protein
MVEGVNNVIAIGAGNLHSLAVTRNGTVWAWGINERGQLGDGTFINRFGPVQVTGLPSIQAAAGGQHHSVFLGRDGSVWTCGADLGGALGIGGTTWQDWKRAVPVRVLNLANVEAIAAGGQSSLAVCADGSVWGWGSNEKGELGINNPKEINAPLRVGPGVDIADGGMVVFNGKEKAAGRSVGAAGSVGVPHVSVPIIDGALDGDVGPESGGAERQNEPQGQKNGAGFFASANHCFEA